MSWSNGPLDPPPPNPQLDITTRDFYGEHNPLPCNFWPSCNHGEETIVQVYELFGDAGRRFFRCPRFKVWICLCEIMAKKPSMCVISYHVTAIYCPCEFLNIMYHLSIQSCVTSCNIYPRPHSIVQSPYI